MRDKQFCDSMMQPDAAETIAVMALRYLAGEPELLSRFLALTGIGPDQLRAAANESGFLAGVLDFFLAHEPSLVGFAEASDIAPEEIERARHVLNSDGIQYA